jgi:hypothetical protein
LSGNCASAGAGAVEVMTGVEGVIAEVLAGDANGFLLTRPDADLGVVA